MTKNYYDEENHKYYVNGEEKASVTDIASPISFERLNALQQSLLDRARQRGSRCHELFEEYLIYGELDVGTIETEYIAYVQQFVLWAKTYKPKVLFTEKIMFGEEFCGTADCFAQIDNEIVLIDYKTTSALDIKSLGVQLAGYKILAEKTMDIKIDKCMVLHLKKDSYSYREVIPNYEWFYILLKHNKFMREKLCKNKK